MASLSPVSKLLKTAITTSNSASVNSPSSDPECGVGEDITIDYTKTGPETIKIFLLLLNIFSMLNIFSVCVLQVRGSEGEWARCAEVGSRCGWSSCAAMAPWDSPPHPDRRCSLCIMQHNIVLPSAASDGKYRYHDAIFVLELSTKFRKVRLELGCLSAKLMV